MGSRAELAGRSLYQDSQARKAFSLMSGEYAPVDIEEAYAAQDAYMDLRAADAGGYGGYKIGYTTKVMQERVGATEPAYGRMLANTVLQSPCTVSASDYARLGIECEVAVRMAADLPASEGPFESDRVFAAVGEIMPAFELIDGGLFFGESSFPQSIAMNLMGAGAVLGEPVSNWRDLDLASARCELKLNGEFAGNGLGSDLNGHPVEPMVWIANALRSRGRSLQKGDVVITGSMIPPAPLETGASALLTMDGLGSVTLKVE